MSDQPKPTDEWKAETVQSFGTCRKIVEAHNAALAAERERVVSAFAVDAANAEEIIKQQEKLNDRLNVEIEQLREQLAAAQAAMARSRNQGWNEGREHERKCVAAAQQPLVDALTKFRALLESCPIDCLGTAQASDGLTWPIRDEVIDGINAALAKIEKK